MINAVLILIILAIVSLSVWYIYREKKRGNHCIGCPYAKTCMKNNCKSKNEDC